MEYLLIAGACAVVAYGFGYFLMRRVQALLLEYFVTLVASTIPMGMVLILDGINTSRRTETITRFVCLGLLPVCLVIGGSVWGISISNRLAIRGAWQRISMMMLGWGFVCSVSSIGGLGLVLLILNSIKGIAGPLLLLALPPLSVAVINSAMRIEERARS